MGAAEDGPDVPFRVSVTRRDSTTIVAPVGEVDLLNARTLYARLVEQADDGLSDLIVDFSALTFIDSTGMAALVKAARDLGAAGVSVQITNASAHTARVLDMTGVNRTIPITAAD